MAEVIVNSEKALNDYIDHLRSQFDKHKYLRITVKTGKQRSLTQNAAMHLYCEHVASALNDAGLDFRQSLREDVDVPWSGELVKEYMWRVVQKAITGQQSTTKPERHQYSEIYDVLNRHISEKWSIFVPWPCKDTMNEVKR